MKRHRTRRDKIILRGIKQDESLYPTLKLTIQQEKQDSWKKTEIQISGSGKRTGERDICKYVQLISDKGIKNTLTNGAGIIEHQQSKKKKKLQPKPHTLYRN